MQRLPHGSWPSPIDAGGIAAGSLRLSQPRWDGGSLYWIEGRPAEGGRQVLMRADAEGAISEVSPPAVNVRTRVHEYGGGDYDVRDGVAYYARFDDQRVYRVAAGGGAAAEPVTAPGACYADLTLSPDGRWLAAVEERPRETGEAENRIVAIPTAGGAPLTVAAGHDFFSFPRFAPDGDRIVWTAWDHPGMPWDGTVLYRAGFSAGRADAPRAVAGGASESIFQPSFSPGGRLAFVTDRSGWWNLALLQESGVADVCPRAAEFGRPQWVFGLSTHAFVGEDAILCIVASGGWDGLARVDLATGTLTSIDVPYRRIDGLCVAKGRACFVGAGPDRAPAVVALDLASGALREVRSGLAFAVSPALVSVPEAIEFATDDGARSHAFLYRPRNPDAAAPAGERPPLLVKSHGGPTGAALPVLDLRVQYWTSRGFAVVDVNYRGSVGYGRPYREALRGAWGIADVADCIAAARYLEGEGEVDSARLAISGGSAGGYTTLCALTFHDVFHAGASHYGIGDLEALVRDTHKFESRYLDGLIGPYPERRDLYRERSPIHFTDRLSCPVIFFQGLEDRVVLPNQAEAMVAALAERGVTHAYVAFPGEQHGFRRAENICTALEGELGFYAQVFGFDAGPLPAGVRIVAGGASAGESV